MAFEIHSICTVLRLALFLRFDLRKGMLSEAFFKFFKKMRKISIDKRISLCYYVSVSWQEVYLEDLL